GHGGAGTASRAGPTAWCLLAVVQVAVAARPRCVAGTSGVVGPEAVVPVVDGGQLFHRHQEAAWGRRRCRALCHLVLLPLRFSRQGSGGRWWPPHGRGRSGFPWGGGHWATR